MNILSAQAAVYLTTPEQRKPQWEVIDRQTGLRVGGPYATAQRARNRRDALDLQYGACRYTARPVAV